MLYNIHKILDLNSGICIYLIIYIILFKICKLFIKQPIEIFKLIGELFGLTNVIIFLIYSTFEFIQTYDYNFRFTFMQLFLSYYIVDLIYVIFDFILTNNYMSIIYIIHHLLVLFIMYFVIYKTKCNNTTTYIILCIELSNLFKYFYIFSSMYFNNKNNICNLITLIIWTIVFIILRLIVIPIISGKIYYKDIPDEITNQKYGIIILLLLIITQILSMIWSYKLIQKIQRF